MGLTKQYLAYQPAGTFNAVTGGKANACFVTLDRTEGRFVAVGAAEDTIVWDLRLGTKALQLTSTSAYGANDRLEVTALCASPDRLHLACGYADGSLRVYHLLNAASAQQSDGAGRGGYVAPEFQLALHRSAVTVLRYDGAGMRLVTGSLDTDLCVVDCVEQVGRARLVGHSAAVTAASWYEQGGADVVISASKDTRIKFWSVETQSCFRTVCDSRGDVWALALMRDARYLVSGSAESTLNVYELKVRDTNAPTAPDSADSPAEIVDSADGDSAGGDLAGPVSCKLTGTIMRGGKGRTVTLATDPTGAVLGCHGTDDTIDVFYFCTAEEALARLTKRVKKLALAGAGKPKAEEAPEGEGDSETAASAAAAAARALSLSDEVRRLAGIRTPGKLKSIDLLLGAGGQELRVAATFAKNFVHLYALPMAAGRGAAAGEAQLLRSLTQPGHQSEVRAVAFSSDGLALATGSAESLKLWNRQSGRCVRTVADCGYVLSVSFVPGDRHVLCGMKSGALLVVDVVVGVVLEEVAAHQAECWSVALLPDQKGCVTGGGDCTVKVWHFELIDAEPKPDSDDSPSAAVDGAKVLSLLHKDTLKLEETVFCVRVSPNGKFIAVGLINATVQIFFMDTFRFYLSLYGHKLPVLCLDISDDSRLIATGSADRNVKIWGMDFGDCHRSLFAHDDSVMALQFVAGSHHFWTCGKDGRVKQWDGDAFVKICTLPGGHIGEAYALAVDASGHYVASCGSDRVVRCFERTQETLVLQDQQEEEREQLEREQLATGEDTQVAGAPGLRLASRKTVGAEQAAESLIECLEVCVEFERQQQQANAEQGENGEAVAAVEVPPLMRAYGATNGRDYLMAVLEKVRPNELEEALLLLPFDAVRQLLETVPQMTEQRKDRTELICKCVLFLMRVHQRPIVATQTLLPVLQSVVARLRRAVGEQRDLIGVNNHALQMLQRDIETRDGIELFRDASKAKKKNDKRNKKRQLTKRLHVQMN